MAYPKMDISNGKLCRRCNKFKPVEEFSKAKTAHGLQTYCKPCMSEKHDEYRRRNLEKIATQQRERYAKDPERYRGYELKKLYGISLEEFKSLFEKQNGACLICKTTNPNGKGEKLHVDHCHSSEKVRGLLCTSCNIGLGHFKHSVELLQSAISYLAESS